MEPSSRFWPLSPRLWRKSNDYSKKITENKKPTVPLPLVITEEPNKTPKWQFSNIPPDLIRSRSFINDRDSILYEIDRNSVGCVVKKSGVIENRRVEEVKLRVKAQRQPRPNSLQLLLCKSASGHCSSKTWRYTKIRSRRYVYF